MEVLIKLSDPNRNSVDLYSMVNALTTALANKDAYINDLEREIETLKGNIEMYVSTITDRCKEVERLRSTIKSADEQRKKIVAERDTLARLINGKLGNEDSVS